MNEQISMFTDPLREMALKTIREVIKKESDIDYVFNSFYGGCRTRYEFLFDPRTRCFYYSDKNFSTYKPEPWVRKITKKEIRELIGG